MKIAVFGATSAMAQAACREWAEQGVDLFLVGRNSERLNAVTADLMTRGATIQGAVACDLENVAGHVPMLTLMEQQIGIPDVILIAYGVLPASNDRSLAIHAIQVNGSSPIMLIEAMKERWLQDRRPGLVLAISSVASVRGKASNYLYCAAKGLLSTYLEGLRHAMQRQGVPVQVVDIRPGQTDTPMTSGLAKDGMLWSSVATVGKVIAQQAVRWTGGKTLPGVVYAPGYWRWIMLVIRHLPERVFKKLNL